MKTTKTPTHIELVAAAAHVALPTLRAGTADRAFAMTEALAAMLDPKVPEAARSLRNAAGEAHELYAEAQGAFLALRNQLADFADPDDDDW